MVSVLMSVYNGEEYLKAAIDSIIEQSYSDFEFIIIDDGSTDSTHKIISNYDDKRIVCIHNEKNLGLTPSLNIGIKAANGKYIARQDADDISLADRLKKQVVFMEEHPEIGVLGTQMDVINEKGEKTNVYNLPCKHSEIVWQLLFGRSFAHPSVIIRKKTLDLIKGYNPDFIHSEDLALWTSLVGLTKFANLSDRFVSYRATSGSISVKQANTQYSNTLLLRQLLISKTLGREVSIQDVEHITKFQNSIKSLTEEEVKRAVENILGIYNGLLEKGLMIEDEAEAAYSDMINRIIAVSRSTRNISELSKEDPLLKV